VSGRKRRVVRISKANLACRLVGVMVAFSVDSSAMP